MASRRLRIEFFAAAAAIAALLGCDRSERRELEYMPDMYHSPAVKAQEEYHIDGKRWKGLPPANTVSTTQTKYPLAWNQLEEADLLVNPLPRTREVLETGRKYYNIFCIACHNYNGNGVTPVTQPGRMPMPPALYTDKIKEWKDGRLFHTITHGQGNMPGYDYAIEPEVRWAIVHYVRVLGEAATPDEATQEDFKAKGGSFAKDNPLEPAAKAAAH